MGDKQRKANILSSAVAQPSIRIRPSAFFPFHSHCACVCMCVCAGECERNSICLSPFLARGTISAKQITGGFGETKTRGFSGPRSPTANNALCSWSHLVWVCVCVCVSGTLAQSAGRKSLINVIDDNPKPKSAGKGPKAPPH